MKILFLCGCLEPGRDGVGDYVRCLSGELIRQGHQAAAIAVNDSLMETSAESLQEVDGIKLPVLRISSALSSKNRFHKAKVWAENFGPDWISLQYVPYSFHIKGLPIQLSRQLNSLIIKGRKLHIMFHETWIGQGSFKQTVTAFLQKKIISHLVNTLKPSLIHTHIPAYSYDLQNLGLIVKSLPLFSNIPINVGNGQADECLIIGFFSQIADSEKAFPFLTRMSKLATQENKPLEILLIGGGKNKMMEFGKSLENLDGFKEKVKYMGFLEPKELSETLQKCSLGVSTVPRHLLGKSGTVAAFIAHGVPVAAPNINPAYKPTDLGFFSQGIREAIILDPEYPNLLKAKKAVQQARDEIKVSTIANKMLSDMKSLS